MLLQLPVCTKYKRPFQRSVVSMPMASKFKKVVSMDLAEYKHNKIWILHLIHGATRYSAACFVRVNNKGNIIKQIYKIWIAYFRSPDMF